MRTFEYLLKQVSADVFEFANTASQRPSGDGAALPDDLRQPVERRASSSEHSSDDWLSALARLRAGDSPASSPIGIVRAIEAAFATSDAVSRGAYWWLIAEAWQRASEPGEVSRRLSAILPLHFRLDPTFEGLEDVAAMWMHGISSLVNDAKSKMRRDAASDMVMRALAGADRAKIDRSVADAKQFLTHALPIRRIAAIKALTEAEETPAWLPAKLREMARSDPDCKVRRCAIVQLTSMYRRTGDVPLLSFLAKIALDGAQPRPLRFFAYHGLFVISGAPTDEWPYEKVRAASDDWGVPFLTGKDDAWPCEMDWEFAASFLKPEETP